MSLPLARCIVAFAALGLASAAGPPAAEPLRIVSPTERTIVVGATPVVVEGPADLFYRVYRRQTPDEKGTLVCKQPGPPSGSECVFDAGKDLASESLLVEAVDPGGRVVASASTETYFFQEPEVTVASRSNPRIEAGVVGTSDAVRALVADPSRITCELGGRPCRVAEIEPLANEGVLRVTLLIDESGSIGREGLARLIPAVGGFVELVDEATRGALAVEYEVVFFSDYVRNATHGYTDDIEDVARVLAGSAPSGGTCLYTATASTLRDIQNRRLTDRYAGRSAAYALIIWSDGQNACPNRFTTADVAVEEAYWSESPTFVVPLKLEEPCRFRCTADPEFLQLGRLSGGETYGEFNDISELLGGDIFEHLMSRYVLEIEPDDLAMLDDPHVLSLEAAGDVSIRHRGLVAPAPPQRKLAMRVLDGDRSDIEAKAAAADLLSKEPGQARARVAQAIYGELREVIRDLGRDLERQARDAGADGIADQLRSTRRRRNLLTGEELAIVRALRAEDRAVFMRSRNTMLEAIITLTGRALLWREDAATHRDFLGLIEEMQDRGYRLVHDGSRLPVFLEAYLDPEFPGDPRVKEEVAELLAAPTDM